MNSYIYQLLDENNHCFYVGQSIDPANRLEQHIDESVQGTSKKCRFIRDMIKRGRFPTHRVVDEAPLDQIDALEAQWINKVDCTKLDDGYVINLQNSNAGSHGNGLARTDVERQVQQFQRDKRRNERIARAKRANDKAREQSRLWDMFKDDESVPQLPSGVTDVATWADEHPHQFKLFFEDRQNAINKLIRKHKRQLARETAISGDSTNT